VNPEVGANGPARSRSNAGRRVDPDLLIAVLMLVLVSLPLVGHAYLGSFSRYIADDFCTAAHLRLLGFWGSQIAWYREWSGRFSFTFLISIAHLLGPRFTPWLPGLAIGAWYGSLLLLFRRIERTRDRRLPLFVSSVLAALTLTLTLEGSPSIYQSLYWETGMLTYSLPLILGTLSLAWLVSSLRASSASHQLWPWELAGSLVFAFFAGGFSETYASLQLAGLAGGLLISQLVLRGGRRGQATQWLGAGLVGALLSFAAVALAPGSQVRMALMPAHPAMWDLIERTAQDIHIFLYQVAKYQTIHLVLAVAAPGLLVFLALPDVDEPGQSTGRTGLALLGAIPLLTAALVAVAFAPYEYAVSSYPDPRVLITQQYVLFLAIVVWSGLAGLHARRALRHRGPALTSTARILLSVSVALAFLVTARFVEKLRDDVPVFADFSTAWESRDAYLRMQASQHSDAVIAAASLRHMGGLAEIGDNPSEWINVCVAEAYDARAVIAK
jgi:hypothetical protein